MPKLILLPEEVKLIKGLTIHTGLNNQAITAIFSFLDRNINHREIGSIRNSIGKYTSSTPSSKQQVGLLLARYGRLQALARKIAILPSEENITRIDKSIELMKTAVVIYNNPAMSFRSELFIVNASIAWTYAMHAYYQNAKIQPIYTDAEGKPVLIDLKPKFWDLSACISSPTCPLELGIINNLKYIIALRNEIEHRMSRGIDDFVRGKIQACAINFSDFCENNFGACYALKYDLDFALQFSSLTMDSPNISSDITLPPAIEAVNKLVEDGLSEKDYNDLRYSYRVWIIPKTINNPKKADQAVNFAAPGSAIGMAIKQVERPKLRASELIAELKKEGLPATMQSFIDFWKAGKLKDSKKGLCIELGKQWFWYPEAVDIYRNMLKTLQPSGN